MIFRCLGGMIILNDRIKVHFLEEFFLFVFFAVVLSFVS